MRSLIVQGSWINATPKPCCRNLLPRVAEAALARRRLICMQLSCFIGAYSLLDDAEGLFSAVAVGLAAASVLSTAFAEVVEEPSTVLWG